MCDCSYDFLWESDHMKRFLHSVFLYVLYNKHSHSFKYGEFRNIEFLPVVFHFNFLFCGLFKVMKEVCSNGNGVVDCDGAGSGSPIHKAELEKVWIHNYIYVKYICVCVCVCGFTMPAAYMQVYLHAGMWDCVSVCMLASFTTPQYPAQAPLLCIPVALITVALLPGHGGL